MKKILIVGGVFIVFQVPYFLLQSYDKTLHLFTDIFYTLIQLQFFVAYFVLGDIMMTNKTVCKKASRRGKWIKFVSFYFLIEPVLWLWLLKFSFSELTFAKIFLGMYRFTSFD